jgi:hypothetical protein
LKAKIDEDGVFAKKCRKESVFTVAGYAQSNKRLPLAQWLVHACGCS